MKLIQKLSDMIEEELQDARKYVRCALEHKDGHPDLARTFANLSNQEMDHAQILHSAVVDLINEYRNQHGDPPERMRAVYDFLHQRQLDEATEIRVMQEMFRR